MQIAMLLVFLLTLPLMGQQKQTHMWGGLRLGMTAGEARKALPYPTRVPRKRDQVPGKSVPGLMRLHIPKGLFGTLPVTGALYFGEKGDGLTGVLLGSDHDSPNYCDMPDNLERQAAALLWKTFMGELRKQNGEPSSSRTVDGENSGVSTMLAIWRGVPGYPDIALLLTGSCKRIDVTVTYAPSGFRKR